jgi:hypothetical protein
VKENEMKFLLLCHHDEQSWNKLSETEQRQHMAEATQLVRQLKSHGQYLASAPLYPTSTATSVRVRSGKSTVTDGPYAETHEQLGGFYLIDVPNVQEAINIAERHPGARVGTVSVRQVVELAGLPASALGKGSAAQSGDGRPLPQNA